MAIEAHTEREKAELRRLAWHAVNVMNVWLPRGKQLRIEDVLNEDGGERPVFLDKEALDRYMLERIAAAKASEASRTKSKVPRE